MARAYSVTDNGVVDGARFIACDNCDERPEDSSIDLLVIHAISLPPGVFGGPAVIELFTNALDPQAHPYYESIAGLRVSAHLLIRRDGELLQFVPCDKRAWHAGASAWQGRTRCNDFSIGIELEGTDELPYEHAQYRELARLIDTLCRTYPSLARERVAGHSDIAPGRKTDPGESFDWPRLRAMLRAQAARY